jgi:hypothetical protein
MLDFLWNVSALHARSHIRDFQWSITNWTLDIAHLIGSREASMAEIVSIGEQRIAKLFA